MQQAHCKATMGEDRGGTVRGKLSALLQSDSAISPQNATDGEISSTRNSSASSSGSPSDLSRTPGSPYMMSPWIPSSPYMKSPWSRWVVPSPDTDQPACGLVASMVREEGHVYSLATSGELLYTGSDGKNIRVWKNQREFSGFKSNSGLVKAIVIAGGKIFTGHQDGKIRVWRSSSKDPGIHKKVGTLPTLKELVKSSLNPNNYVEVRRRRNSVWLRHFDAVSCLSLDQEEELLYSGSWDKTVKVWRITDSKCLESINAHDDAVNTVVAAGFDSMVLTGSADGTVKVWRREARGRNSTRHVMEDVLLKLDSAVTALAVCAEARVAYSGSSDGSVSVWEKRKRMVHRGLLRGHKLAVLCVVAAGTLLFSGSADKTISVWRREGGGEHTWMAVLSGHGGPVKCLAVEEEEEEEEGRRRWVVYSGSLDRSVKVWKVAEQSAEMQAVGRLGSAVDEEEFAFPLVGRGAGMDA